jgi:hypothetical protein
MTQVKLTLNEIAGAVGALNQMGENKDLSFKLSYRIAKIAKKLEPILSVYQDARNQYITDNGVKNEETGNMEIPSTDAEKILEFTKHNDELLQEESEVELDLIPESLFEDTNVTPNQVRSILWAIEEG